MALATLEIERLGYFITGTLVSLLPLLLTAGGATVLIFTIDPVLAFLVPLLVPLFINALRRGEDLIVAMDARGYLGAKGRSRYVRLQSEPLDWILVLLAFLGAGLVWWMERG